MTIDEAIEKFRDIANNARNDIVDGDNLESQESHYNAQLELYAKEHEQIAEWLEELKAIKSDGFTDDLLNMGFTKGYNKAIDDFAESLKSEYEKYDIDDIFENSDIAYTDACYIFEQYIEQIAEQLKEGGEN